MHRFFRSLAIVVGIICVLTTTIGLLAGNVRYRLLMPDLYRSTLIRKGVYDQMAVALVDEAELPLVTEMSAANQLHLLANAVIPNQQLQTMTEDALAQSFDYLNDPAAPSTITIPTLQFLEHLDEIIIVETCQQIPLQFNDRCLADLPALVTYLQETTQIESQFDIEQLLTGIAGSPRENVVWLTQVTAVTLQFVGIVLLIMFMSMAATNNLNWFVRWLGSLLLGIGVVLGLIVFGTAQIIGGILTPLPTQSDITIIQTTNRFLGQVGERFSFELYIQVALCLLIGLLMWANGLWRMRKHPSN